MMDIDRIFSMLSWNNAEEIQQEGIQAAQKIEHLSVWFQPIESKSVWENCAKVLASKSNDIYGIDLITLLDGSYVAAGCPIEGSALDNEIIVDQPCIYLGYDVIFPILFDKYYGDGG